MTSNKSCQQTLQATRLLLCQAPGGDIGGAYNARTNAAQVSKQFFLYVHRHPSTQKTVATTHSFDTPARTTSISPFLSFPVIQDTRPSASNTWEDSSRFLPCMTYNELRDKRRGLHTYKNARASLGGMRTACRSAAMDFFGVFSQCVR